MSGYDQFSLRWNDFENKLSCGVQTLKEEGLLYDVTLAVGGHVVQAHKLVLAVCSEYFKHMLMINPCKHPIIILKDVGLKELEALLDFMYKGEAQVSQENLEGFLKAAELLQISGLAESSQGKTFTPRQKDTQFKTDNARRNQKRKAQREGSSDIDKKLCIDPLAPTIKQEAVDSEVLDINVKCGVNVICKEEESSVRNQNDDNDLLSAGQSESSEMFTNETDEVTTFDTKEEIQYVYSRMGQRQLVHNGYIYNRKDQTPKSTIWRCTSYVRTHCKARCVTTNGGYFYETNGNHNHPHQQEEIKKKKAAEAMNRMIELGCNKEDWDNL